MSRVKTFDATGTPPGGKLYAGDLNAIQDQYADQVNYSQSHGVGVLAVGDAGIQLLKYGTSEARITAALRTDGIVRGLGGLFAGQFTTAQRDAIPAGQRPYGLQILNTTDNELQWNAGDDAMPMWMSVAMRGDGIHAGHAIVGESANLADDVLTVRQVGNSNGRWIVEAGGKTLWGSGSAIPDVELYRSAANELELLGRFIGVRSAGLMSFGTRDPSDTSHRWALASDGRMEWGPGGAGARDTNLYRPSAGVLKTDHRFETPNIRTSGGVGAKSQFGVAGLQFHTFKLVSVLINAPELNAFTGSGPTNYVLPGGTCLAGDYIMLIGCSNDLMRYYTQTIRPTAPLNDRVEITWFNTDNSQRNPGNSSFTFGIWNIN